MKHFTEFLAWMRIALSPILFTLILAVLVYWYADSPAGNILAVCILILGVIAGVLLAEYARKHGGAINFISKLHASPELDKKKD